MFKKASFLAITFLAIFSTGAVNAMCTTATQSCTGSLSRILINDAGQLSVSFDGLDVRDTGCTAASNFMNILSDNPQFKNYYAMILTASAADAEIFIRVQTGSPICEVRNMFLTGN